MDRRCEAIGKNLSITCAQSATWIGSFTTFHKLARTTTQRIDGSSYSKNITTDCTTCLRPQLQNFPGDQVPFRLLKKPQEGPQTALVVRSGSDYRTEATNPRIR